ncbi:tyrosine-protein phosphatase [Mucilaginibacter myungsuensis]|uniref:protein-tyrosine-phosphatase n=1 Tax=Mucilaginibacter myungsuensis TaxID=649104 RepID=A0A929KV46_9SPHI|nr:CpsB/CapC family capsule biosynthesis tyrosine phosphatase [Mucilaginibacter myungsuensis]MBE9661015.1 capsular biosynthesis protein [Mucilaginibacter myungsuensis]MDN3597159.1 capsular biosynthesis protein [Mucilaginibacter myungsuensis]
MFGFFKKKPKIKKEATYDYSDLMVDMHSHVLPGIDDGAQTVEESIYLIKKMMDLGIKKVIATPHVMVDMYRNTPDIINDALARLQQALKQEGIAIPVEAAAEHMFDEGFEEKIDNGQLMVMKTGHVLFEFSFIQKPYNLIPVIQKLVDKGYKPILAHPERYPYLTLDELKNIRSWGCDLQLNTISLTGYYGGPTKQIAEQLVDEQMIDFLSSDMHHPRHASALKQALLMPYLDKLMADDYPLKNKMLY